MKEAIVSRMSALAVLTCSMWAIIGHEIVQQVSLHFRYLRYISSYIFNMEHNGWYTTLPYTALNPHTPNAWDHRCSPHQPNPAENPEPSREHYPHVEAPFEVSLPRSRPRQMILDDFCPWWMEKKKNTRLQGVNIVNLMKNPFCPP